MKARTRPMPSLASDAEAERFVDEAPAEGWPMNTHDEKPAQPLGSDLEQAQVRGVQPEDYLDAPEVTDKMLEHATLRRGGKIIGRPFSQPPRQPRS